jgi:hypothetical protein
MFPSFSYAYVLFQLLKQSTRVPDLKFEKETTFNTFYDRKMNNFYWHLLVDDLSRTDD